MRILFLAPYPEFESPSQRFRFEHYLPELTRRGIEFDYRPFTGLSTWRIIFKKGHFMAKAWGVVKGFLRRFLLMFRLGKYDFVYIHREASPLGPPIFEWMIAKIWRKKIIYDFDDAIWIPAVSANNRIAASLKYFSKVRRICKWAYKVSVGNAFLREFASRYNPSVEVIPTVVDTDSAHNRLQVHDAKDVCVGWTGSFSTLKYLDMIMPALAELQETMDFNFLVIADKDPKLPLKRYTFVPWNKETEINDLLRMHIGVMPLHENDLAKGKCGFKAIQYMAVGIPPVVSPVGVNSVIVDNGVNGFVCSGMDEWKTSLGRLLTDTGLRREMGAKAREKIVNRYSVTATVEPFIKLFA